MASQAEIEAAAIAIGSALPNFRNKIARCAKAARLALEAAEKMRVAEKAARLAREYEQLFQHPR